MNSCRGVASHRDFVDMGSTEIVDCMANHKVFFRSGRVSRSIEQEKPQPQKVSPQLMEFPWVVWPSLWHSIRNWIFANLLIHRYLDQEFEMTSFKKGAIQALVYVSQELSKGNFESLEGLVTSPSLEEIKKNFAHFSLKQRLDLAVEKEDIFFSFPYQIGMIFTNEGTTHERIFVEITMCYHIFRGFQEYVNSPSASEGGLRAVYDNHERISIANYRFIREFTKGVVDDWTISLANHFKPGEHLQRQ
ncbi:m-AAA protease-interacting protein 1, mitochondrial-like [Portunus trituberculatus]|uniref:m-AAA protease-interacting protein 1, mitochondrial-like n=1 Tax=Portunus trituberculatus TaxID=210409 RepID=UPI001E1D0B7C|nr:m-AAA protease-interacting protein 1, mitochondrial-like [Portunus trituberculatus]